MNKINLFVVATILATASLIAGTFTVAPSFAQVPTPPGSGYTSSPVMGADSLNTTSGGNITSNSTDNSTVPPM